MYKLLTLLLLIGVSSAMHSFQTPLNNLQRLTTNPREGNVKLDFCPLCINEAVEVINVLLNVILDEGILGTCQALCDAVVNKTGSKLAGDICMLACDGIGIDEFIRLIITLDLDPILYCELADLCAINDHGDAVYTNFGVTPSTGPQGTTFIIDCSFKTVNGTGTSMLRVYITDPQNQTDSNDYLVEAKKPGIYAERIGMETLTALNCDSTRGLCDSFPVGTYNVTAQFCNGECDSHHEHSQTYAVGKASFTVTKKK